jgi:hypothetical protein
VHLPDTAVHHSSHFIISSCHYIKYAILVHVVVGRQMRTRSISKLAQGLLVRGALTKTTLIRGMGVTGMSASVGELGPLGVLKELAILAANLPLLTKFIYILNDSLSITGDAAMTRVGVGTHDTNTSLKDCWCIPTGWSHAWNEPHWLLYYW